MLTSKQMKAPIKVFVGSLLVLTSGCLNTSANNVRTTIVTGRVFNHHTGRAVPKFTVRIINYKTKAYGFGVAAPETLALATSDDNGRFQAVIPKSVRLKSIGIWCVTIHDLDAKKMGIRVIDLALHERNTTPTQDH